MILGKDLVGNAFVTDLKKLLNNYLGLYTFTYNKNLKDE
jgi:hypothetical protein